MTGCVAAVEVRGWWHRRYRAACPDCGWHARPWWRHKAPAMHDAVAHVTGTLQAVR